MPRISPIQVAMGLGANGAMVDVSSYIDFGVGFSRSYGQTDDFRDPQPGTFSFKLDNYDGRFTPGSTTYATPVTEGMPVSWLLGTRLVSGSVLSVGLPADEATWGQITITCDDMLGNASRVTLTGANLAEAMVLSSPAYLYWPLSDAAGLTVAAEQSGNLDVPLTVVGAGVTFGVTGVPAVGGVQTQARISGNGALILGRTYGASDTRNIQYSAGSFGVWSFWLTPEGDPGSGSPFGLGLSTLSGAGALIGVNWQVTSLATGFQMVIPGPGGGTVSTPALVVNVPHFFSTAITYNAGASSLTFTLYMDGVLIGSATQTSVTITPTPTLQWAFSASATSPTFTMQHLSHTRGLFNEQVASANTAAATEATLLPALGQMNGNVTLGTLPTNLSVATVGPVATTGATLFQLLCDVVRTERGYLYTATTGSLLSPVQNVVIRARDRPATPAVTLDANQDISGVPPFLRDITNTVSSVAVTGIGAAATATDNTVAARVGAANASETVINNQSVDIYTWATDRIGRGKNPTLRLQTITVDLLTISAAQAAAVLALLPGDLVRLSGLPSATLGFTSWNGWLIGASESHTINEHRIDILVATALPATAVYDTGLYAGGALFHVTALNPILISDTAITLTVAPGDVLETTTVGYSILIDNEVLTVTAASFFGGNYSCTVTRAQSGTTATAHPALSTVEIIPTALYAF